MSAAAQHRAMTAPIQAVPSEFIPNKNGTVAVLPENEPDTRDFRSDLQKQVPELKIAPLSKETAGIVWLDIKGPPAAQALEKVLDDYPQVGWVQLPQAGVNNFANVIKKNNKKVWTSAKGSFAQPVAEHALALALALLRNFPKRIRATEWGTSSGLSLFGRKVTIIGAGGITLALLALLAPFDVQVTVLRRRAEPLDDSVIPPQLKSRLKVDSFKTLHDHLPSTEVLFLAAALTADTKGIIGAKEFEALPTHAVVVNVARGEHIQTDALVQAIQKGSVAGVGTDVTAPEPLPSDHPLWKVKREPNAAYEKELPPDEFGNLIITPHTADTATMCGPLLKMRFATNAKALLAGDGKFEGVIDNEHAY
ncbi:unnamed protein product [Sympodiomycopsis kandeliae]